MTSVRSLEAPLRAWRSFRDIARATRTLAAAQALHWSELARVADAHLAWCEAVAAEHRPLPGLEPGPRVVLVLGSDLGLCGPLNQRIADLCREARLADPPTISAVVVGARLALLEPLPELANTIELPTPSTLPAARLLAAQIEAHVDTLLAGLDPERDAPLELSIVLAGAVEGDGSPRVELRTSTRLDLEPPAQDQRWFEGPRSLLGEARGFAAEAEALARHARIVAALCRALTSENEARLRAMSRAYESAQRRIGEQERRLRKLRQELITQEMLEARSAPT